MMSLISFSYYGLVLAALAAYYLLPRRFQWIVLLTVSLVFFLFSGNPWTIVYLIAGILITWYAGRQILSARQRGESARFWLAAALAADLGMLCALKYMNFLLGNAAGIVSLFTGNTFVWRVNWPAALGMSYYTLQIVGYLLDCWWGIAEPQENLGKFALFTCFFPQMISGPISRYNQLRDELYTEHSFQWNNLREGGMRIAVGIFKKVGVAENLLPVTERILDLEIGWGGFMAIAGMFAAVIQLYADFSGCIDIVIGTAQCFGITMPENFHSPFASRSVQEFWQRWHMTLGLWLRDYVMYPLLRSKAWRSLGKVCRRYFGKQAAKRFPTDLAMLVLWLCNGLWHGGGWNYLLMGTWFWGIVSLSDWLAPVFRRITNHFDTKNPLWIGFQRFRTAFLYAIGFMMFRAPSAGDFFRIMGRMFSPSWLRLGPGEIIAVMRAWEDGYRAFVIRGVNAVVAFCVFLILTSTEAKFGSLSARLRGKPAMFQALIVFLLFYVLLFVGAYGPGYDPSQFIYAGF